MKLTFEWDEIKAIANIKKHRVGFDEGKTIFNDSLLLTYPDVDYPGHEDRFINLGLSAKGRILVLIHIERRDKIRIISCRKATSRERRYYEESRP